MDPEASVVPAVVFHHPKSSDPSDGTAVLVEGRRR